MQPALRGLRNTAQEALLPPLEKAISRGLTLLPIFNGAIGETGKVLGQAAERGAEMATSGPWRADLAQVASTNTRVIGSLANAGLSAADGLRNITVAAAPLLERLARGTERGMALAAAFIQARRDGGQLEGFFQRAGDTGAQLWGILRDIGLGVLNIGRAAAPAGQQLLNSLSAAATSFRTLTGEGETQAKLAGYFANTVPVLQEVGRLVAALGVAWFNFTNNPTLAPLIARLRTDVLPAVAELAGSLGNGELWGQLVGLLTSIAGIAAQLGGLGNTLSGFLFVIQAVASAVQVLLSIPGMGAFVSALLTIAGVAGGIMFVANAIGAVRGALTLLSANPIMLIVAAVAAVVLGLVTAYQKVDWFRNAVNGAFSGLADGVRYALDSMVSFATWSWGKLSGIFAPPIRFLVNTVYDGGIRKAWNWIADSFGLGKLPSFTVGFARGGVVPGYAPGRDTVPAMLSPGKACSCRRPCASSAEKAASPPSTTPPAPAASLTPARPCRASPSAGSWTARSTNCAGGPPAPSARPSTRCGPGSTGCPTPRGAECYAAWSTGPWTACWRSCAATPAGEWCPVMRPARTAPWPGLAPAKAS